MIMMSKEWFMEVDIVVKKNGMDHVQGIAIIQIYIIMMDIMLKEQIIIYI